MTARTPRDKRKIELARHNDWPSWCFFLILWIAVGAMVALFLIFVLGGGAEARDLGQWDGLDPDLRAWYQNLMQPDVPSASCCGEADAYWCDDYYYSPSKHKAFCRVTDDRADEPRGRPHVAIGTEIEVPANKLKWDKANPTGHGVVFISRGGYVFCYVQPGGV